MRMTRIRPPSSCRPVVNVLESLSLRIGYAKRMLVAVTALNHLCSLQSLKGLNLATQIRGTAAMVAARQTDSRGSRLKPGRRNRIVGASDDRNSHSAAPQSLRGATGSDHQILELWQTHGSSYGRRRQGPGRATDNHSGHPWPTAPGRQPPPQNNA